MEKIFKIGAEKIGKKEICQADAARYVANRSHAERVIADQSLSIFSF